MFFVQKTLRSSSRLIDIAPSFGRTGSRVFMQRASSLTTPTTSATLYYLSRLELYKHEKPYHINVPPSALPPGMQSTEKSEGYDGITVNNLRGREHEFSLDNSGFQVFRDEEKTFSLASALKYDEYADFQTVKSRYRAAVSQFLVERLGAEAVFPFTHEVRRRASVFPRLPRGTGEAPQPVQGVHVDFTPRWAVERTRMAFGEAVVDYLMTRRWQVLNIWRPLFGPLYDWPLAVCDWRSIDPSQDLVASDNVYTHTAAETYNLYHSPSHKWYFLQGMRPEETLVFKSHDSRKTNGTARVCPHAAFRDPLAPADARPRESVECLAIVVYPPSHLEDVQDVQAETLP
ncbi:uncharacterized protein HMPREF1541_05080 [Cyphellophora europaea CBS 101466]|uniref:Methyltransferase n=1 Tax=Cyphellophora europaea (strain CBS 101466) TaxID=1220924 RepID=W2RWT8_CYPE1|nr:uncharacterized protein HMPREF1541_05080 [Cyphellophora europaea CBS 101466]ETN40800.1 hypothetical protein HMPREF1541_05080 [Cyphellophora europaea CBS 101466]